MLKLFAPKKKRRPTIDMMTQNDILPMVVQKLVQQAPELHMPKPKYGVHPTRDVLQNHEFDKTELEPPEQDISPITLPHRVRFSSASPGNLRLAPEGSPSGAPIVFNSQESSTVHSPASSPPHVTQQQCATSMGDVEALQAQVQFIQQLCEKERQEWMKREQAHRLREKEMLEKISETQDQLRQALAQVQQQHQQQQQQYHHHHVSCDDSGYMEYDDEDEDEDEWDNVSYRRAHLPRSKSFERPGSRCSRRYSRRSVSVERPRVDDYYMPRKSRSRGSLCYYGDEDDADVYFANSDSPLDDEEDYDFYEAARPPPRFRMSESTPTKHYVRPRRSYRRSAHYHPAYHYYYPYDAL